jgi:chromosome segregation ATPase
MSDDLTQNLPTSQDGTLAQILTTVQNLSAKIENVDQRLGSLERKVDGLEQKVVGLERRIGVLEQKVEERLYDTRPIWEKVQTDIAGLQEGQRLLQEGQDALRSDVRELRNELHNMNRRFSVLNDNTVQAQANYRELYDRVYDLEKQRP